MGERVTDRRRVRMPALADLAPALDRVRQACQGGDWRQVWLTVDHAGGWQILAGAGPTDGEWFVGVSAVQRRSRLHDTASELVRQVTAAALASGFEVQKADGKLARPAAG